MENGRTMNVGVLILAGGKSSRMGTDKSKLDYKGQAFLDRIASEFSQFDELLVSVDKEEKHLDIQYPMVEDIIPDAGPLGGLYAGLKCSKSEALIIVSCDAPLFTADLAGKMIEQFEEDTDAVVGMTPDGRMHPVCAIYHKRCIPVIERQLNEKNYAMMQLLGSVRVKKYEVGKNAYQLKNVNTPEDYQKLLRPSVLAVCGWKNSGKTTLIEHLVSVLTAQNVRVATIKHDGHRFEPDVEGTDSSRFFRAGAETSIVYDEEKFMITKKAAFQMDKIMDLIGDVDLVLLEGFKESEFPKLEVVRKETQKSPIEKLKNRKAYVTDWEQNEIFEEGRPVFSMDAIEEIAKFILDHMEAEEWKGER